MAKTKGLGDSIDKFTTATGIKKLVKKATGGGCGCNKRREKLNKAFPYKSQTTGKTQKSPHIKKGGVRIVKND